jgi:hypothetical protein
VSTNWLALQAQNPEPTILDAIEFAAPKPKRRVRIVQDHCPSDPRMDMDLMCQIDGDFSWRNRPRDEHYVGLIRDTQAWRAVERIVAAANPDWSDDDLPDLYNESIRDEWLTQLAETEIKFHEFDTSHGNYTYIAHTTPEMCAKLGVEWAHAQEAMEGECKLFQQYAEGDVYGVIVEQWSKECACEDCEAGEWEQIDSCWGFYGSDPFANGMSEHVDEELHAQLRDAEPEY